MKVSLVDVDGHNFPNLALMKLSAWHKMQGDNVDWYLPMFSHPDRIYASKVFTFTPDYEDYACNDPEPIKGGTGYRMYQDLPEEVDRTLPDYSLYPQFNFAIGFLSRGCIRSCPWCVVPKKEGYIRKYDDIERIAQGRKIAVLMDNNFLANDFEFVKEQIEKSIFANIKIDFNQGLDARLVNEENAKLLAKAKWATISGNNKYIRFSCDTLGMIDPVKKAIKTLRSVGYKGHIFVYFLAQEVDETLDRINELLAFDNKIHPFVMPFRNLDGDGQITNPELKRLARWCNMTSVRKSCSYEEYKRKDKKRDVFGKTEQLKENPVVKQSLTTAKNVTLCGGYN